MIDRERKSAAGKDPHSEPWEEMLPGALQAPPVPVSLTRKINSHLQSEWGDLDGVTQPDSHENAEGVIAASAHRLRIVRQRVLPVVAVLAAALLIGFFVVGGSSGYAWASVLDAIAAKGLFQVGVGPESQAVLATGDSNADDDSRAREFMRVLLQQSSEHRDYSIDGLSLRSEDCQREGDQVVLSVCLENARDEIINLKMVLDPDTSLPRSIQFVGSGDLKQESARQVGPQIAMTYPARRMATNKADMIAAASSTASKHVNDPPERLGVSETLEHLKTNVATAPNVKNKNGGLKMPPSQQASLFLASGEATKWQKVEVVHRSPAEVTELVDATLEELWESNGISAVKTASDEELLRRTYLDIAGRTPTVTEVRHYLGDKDPNRYRHLLNKLVGSADHASHLATTWRSHLIPEGIDLSAFGGREKFDRWLAEQLQSDESYDGIVRKLLLAEGRLSKSGPLLFYSAAKLDPDRLAGQTSRFFLGIRLECAQCHDHPFEAWTQEDFWSYAAFFARISRPQAELESVSTVMQVRDVDRGDVMLPETETIVNPRFLGESATDANDRLTADSSVARRESLSKWLTSPENPYFARATVNRIWSLMFGRGIVDPVDDFGTAHPPLSPELLDILASQLIDSNFDLGSVTKTIALSRAYQLSSAGLAGDTGDQQGRRLRYFAQMEVKTLTAAQLYDCVAVATLLEEDAGNRNVGFQLNRFGNSSRDQFLQQFASPAGNRVEYMSGIPQALTLMNGGLIGSATGTTTSGVLSSLEAPFFTNQQRIEMLFLATLSRHPTNSEWKLLREAVPDDASTTDRATGLADILWALLNSAEFSMNH